jgi:hypothetical protein
MGPGPLAHYFLMSPFGKIFLRYPTVWSQLGFRVIIPFSFKNLSNLKTTVPKPKLFPNQAKVQSGLMGGVLGDNFIFSGYYFLKEF